MNQRFDCEATASMLDSGRVLALASQAAAVISAFKLMTSHDPLFIVSLILWPVACWYAVRVSLDASLFRAMAREPEASAQSLDEFLRTHALGRAPKPRSIEDRCRGALRLLRRLSLVVAAQVVFDVVGIILNIAL